MTNQSSGSTTAASSTTGRTGSSTGTANFADFVQNIQSTMQANTARANTRKRKVCSVEEENNANRSKHISQQQKVGFGSPGYPRFMIRHFYLTLSLDRGNDSNKADARFSIEPGSNWKVRIENDFGRRYQSAVQRRPNGEFILIERIDWKVGYYHTSYNFYVLLNFYLLKE